MMSVYLELRPYLKEEIGEILNLNLTDKRNFNRNLRAKMKSLGFTEEKDYVVGRKEITILKISATTQDKILYLVRLLGIDTRIDPIEFSIFIYCMTYRDEYKMMPWEERAKTLNDVWNIEISEKTLRNWTSKLIILGELTKDKSESSYWCTQVINGIKKQYEVVEKEDIELMRQYYKDMNEFVNSNRKKIDKIKEETGAIPCYKTKNGTLRPISPWDDVFSKLWNKYQRCYYKCCDYIFIPWHTNELVAELFFEIKKLIKEIYDEEPQDS